MTRALRQFCQIHGVMTILVSGETGIDGLVFAFAITAGLNEAGFRNTFRLVGALATLLICVSCNSQPEVRCNLGMPATPSPRMGDGGSLLVDRPALAWPLKELARIFGASYMMKCVKAIVDIA